MYVLSNVKSVLKMVSGFLFKHKKPIILLTIFGFSFLMILFVINYSIFSYAPLTKALPNKIEVYRYGEYYSFDKNNKMFNVLYKKLKPSQKITISKINSLYGNLSRDSLRTAGIPVPYYKESGVAMRLTYEKVQNASGWGFGYSQYKDIFYPLALPTIKLWESEEAENELYYYDENEGFFNSENFPQGEYCGYHEQIRDDLNYTAYSLFSLYYPEKLAEYIISDEFVEELSKMEVY